MEGVYVLLATLLVPTVWLIATYNGMVKLRNYCHESWANVDTELKRRYDLVPNLVETVKGYAKHESDTLERVALARQRAMASTGSAASQANDENELVGSLKTLFALVENYPELKADRHFLALQQELANTEDRIQAARRFYNANVRDMNNRVEVFPSNLVASAFSFTREEYFETDSISATVPQIDLGR